MRENFRIEKKKREEAKRKKKEAKRLKRLEKRDGDDVPAPEVPPTEQPVV
jgi:hypothetical protein